VHPFEVVRCACWMSSDCRAWGSVGSRCRARGFHLQRGVENLRFYYSI